jgi:hypothetical protein
VDRVLNTGGSDGSVCVVGVGDCRVQRAQLSSAQVLFLFLNITAEPLPSSFQRPRADVSWRGAAQQ